ncbi:unnamed protein product [Rotaria magnacalcarata]|nr:unnamed protein product [Rotaria magnacalcarata]
MMLVLLATVETLICAWLSSVTGTTQKLYHFIKSFKGNQLLASDPSRQITVEKSDSAYAYRIPRNVTQQPLSDYNALTANSFTNGATTSTMEHFTLSYRVFYAITAVIIWILVFCALLAAALLWDSAVFSYSRSMRHNWYPDAVSTLERMKNDINNLELKMTDQTYSLLELVNTVSTYHRDEAQAFIDELLRSLVNLSQQLNQEMSRAYSLSEKVPSRFRQAHNHIEEKAKNAGRLADACQLIVDVNITADSFENLQCFLAVVMAHQQKAVSNMTHLIESMRVLVKENRLIELERIIRDYQDTLIDIAGNLYKVDITVNRVSKYVDSRQLYGMKSLVASLTDISVDDQVKAIALGAAVSVVGTVVGVLNIRIGYVMATMFPPSVKGPVIGVASGMGLIYFGAYGFFSYFDDFIEASRFKSALTRLEIERVNAETVMNQLKESIDYQQKALESSQSSPTMLAKRCGLFS